MEKSLFYYFITCAGCVKCDGPVTPGIAWAPGPTVRPSPCTDAGPSPDPCAGKVCALRAGPEPTKGGTELMPVERMYSLLRVCKRFASGL